MKRCSKCREEKELVEFHGNKSQKGGLKSSCKSCVKEYQQSRKEKTREYNKAWREANKDYDKEYRVANKERLSKQHNKYLKERYRIDPLHRQKVIMRTRTGTFLKGNKSDTIENIIGCSYEQLLLHLNFNSLENPSHDHIIPLSWANTKEEMLALCRWENLQAMELEDNVSKGNRYCSKLKADRVAKQHPSPEVIKNVLSRRKVDKDNSLYVKVSMSEE